MPRKVPDRIFKLIPRRKLYRGYKEFDHGANALVHFDYHYGMGYTHGIFLTEDPDYALRFTRTGALSNPDNDKVLTCKIVSNNCASLKELKKLKTYKISEIPENCKFKQKLLDLHYFYDYLIEIGEKETGRAFIENMRNFSTFAVYLGFDYILEERTKHRIVFNRAVINAPESEFDKFCSNSAHYKSGYYDFHDRTKNEEDDVSLNSKQNAN